MVFRIRKRTARKLEQFTTKCEEHSKLVGKVTRVEAENVIIILMLTIILARLLGAPI